MKDERPVETVSAKDVATRRGLDPTRVVLGSAQVFERHLGIFNRATALCARNDPLESNESQIKLKAHNREVGAHEQCSIGTRQSQELLYPPDHLFPSLAPRQVSF